ncbi:MAG: glycosyltransferase family 4 protein, partial [Anaerolineae bacterium]|nr:glycosyltransferase family 4 protein [Anaerolineae bacterium]
RLAPGKGIRHLLDAIAILAKRFPRIESFVVGSGPCESYLREHAKTLGIESHVHFVGYVNHDMLVDWYRAADLLCLPSMFEGFPLTAAEAMACGTPIVASHVGGLPDVVNAFECGILVPPRDPGALSAAIEQMLLNQSNAIPNTEKARESLDWSAKLNRINDLFSEMASS